MTARAEHLRWAKDRALEYADRGETGNAISSLMQDLSLHEETRDSCDIVINLVPSCGHPSCARRLAADFLALTEAAGSTGSKWRNAKETTQ